MATSNWTKEIGDISITKLGTTTTAEKHNLHLSPKKRPAKKIFLSSQGPQKKCLHIGANGVSFFLFMPKPIFIYFSLLYQLLYLQKNYIIGFQHITGHVRHIRHSEQIIMMDEQIRFDPGRALLSKNNITICLMILQKQCCIARLRSRPVCVSWKLSFFP